MLEAHATSRSTRSSGQGQRTDLRLVSSIPVTITHANPDNRQPPRQPPQLTRQPTQGLAQKLNCKYTTMSVIKKKSIHADRQKEFLFRAFPVRPAGQGGKEGSTGGSRVNTVFVGMYPECSVVEYGVFSVTTVYIKYTVIDIYCIAILFVQVQCSEFGQTLYAQVHRLPSSRSRVVGRRGEKLSRTTASDWRRGCPNRFGGWSLQRRSANRILVHTYMVWYSVSVFFSFHSFHSFHFNSFFQLPAAILQLSIEDSRE